MPVPASRSSAEVEAFLSSLEHPLRDTVVALRTINLDSDDRVTEGIKWNAPSFFLNDWFATFHLRARDKIQLVLHTGAKVKARTEPLVIQDPTRLLEWRGHDRALLSFRNLQQVEDRAEAVKAILVQWIAFMK